MESSAVTDLDRRDDEDHIEPTTDQNTDITAKADGQARYSSNMTPTDGVNARGVALETDNHPRYIYRENGEDSVEQEGSPGFTNGRSNYSKGVDTQALETINPSVEDTPAGYPQMAAFLASDENFMLYRRFGSLHARVLLHLQAEITELERRISEEDKRDYNSQERQRLRSYRYDTRGASRGPFRAIRESAFLALRQKLVEYDELIIKVHEMSGFHRPSRQTYMSVRQWMWNVRPVVERDSNFIKFKADIVCIGNGRQWGWFDRFVQRCIYSFDNRLTRFLFSTSDLRRKETFLLPYSPNRIEKLVDFILFALVVCLLVMPIISMYMLTSTGSPSSTFRAIGVLVAFTVLFSASMGIFTTAKRHEVFAASAAYCAILVVFISNFSLTPTR